MTKSERRPFPPLYGAREKWGERISHCSECGVEMLPENITPYCPNCGARMDGGANDEMPNIKSKE